MHPPASAFRHGSITEDPEPTALIGFDLVIIPRWPVLVSGPPLGRDPFRSVRMSDFMADLAPDDEGRGVIRDKCRRHHPLRWIKQTGRPRQFLGPNLPSWRG